MPSSDAPAQVRVIEGMPGAGKTTLLGSVAQLGDPVLAEYTTDTGNILDDHPHHRDEDGHLANWLRKCDQTRTHTGPLWIDRDWLTALAWAASAGNLAERTRWAHQHLLAGRLLLPTHWYVLNVPPQVSLLRRRNQLLPGHPWSQLPVLERLHVFYNDPLTPLHQAHPELTERIATVPYTRIDATETPAAVLGAVTAVGSR
jgi:thymidylate kinase